MLKVTLGADGENGVEVHRLPVECVDTYRPKADPTEIAKKEEEEKEGKKKSAAEVGLTARNLAKIPCEGLVV